MSALSALRTFGERLRRRNGAVQQMAVVGQWRHSFRQHLRNESAVTPKLNRTEHLTYRQLLALEILSLTYFVKPPTVATARTAENTSNSNRDPMITAVLWQITDGRSRE